MIKKSISYIGISFLNVLSLLPLPVLYQFATAGYILVYHIFGYRKKIVRENLINSFPGKTQKEILHVEKAFFRYFTDLIFEIIKLRTISNKELGKRVRISNLELVTSYFDRGESILACTGHYGNWELGMMALGLKIPAKCYVIYKPLSNPVFNQWFYKTRSKTGNVFIPMRQTLRAIAGTKNELTMFCFAGDQTPSKDEARFCIEFLNQPTPVLPGIEKIAIQTSRPVIYFNMQYLKRGYYEIDCTLLTEKPAETEEREITRMTFAFLENIINQNPAYWLWSHRRWKYKPSSTE